MSTKCTVLYDEKFHLYNECFDGGGLYLSLEGSDIEYEVVPNRVVVRIPRYIVEEILNNSEKVRSSLNSFIPFLD